MGTEMVEVDVSELSGPALDWAVAYAINGKAAFFDAFGTRMLGKCITKEVLAGSIKPSTDWSQGGPLIDKYFLTIGGDSGDNRIVYWSYAGLATDGYPCAEGDTHLIAACRAIVVARLGKVVSVPAELLEVRHEN